MRRKIQKNVHNPTSEKEKSGRKTQSLKNCRCFALYKTMLRFLARYQYVTSFTNVWMFYCQKHTSTNEYTGHQWMFVASHLNILTRKLCYLGLFTRTPDCVIWIFCTNKELIKDAILQKLPYTELFCLHPGAAYGCASMETKALKI